MFIAAVLALAAIGLVCIGLAVVGWHLSEQFRLLALLPLRGCGEYGLEVVDVQEGWCTLGAAPSSRNAGTGRRPVVPGGVWGLEWRGGYAQIRPEPIPGLFPKGSPSRPRRLQDAGDRVACEIMPGFDHPRPGDLSRIDIFAYPGNPELAFGTPFREVSYPSALGDFHAWQVDGHRDTWAVIVHGRGASLRECLRPMPVFSGLGLPVLAIAYRNDPDAPASPDGFYRYGMTEWRDVESAVEYALERGAKSVVLMGYSMGGGIAASFMYRSPLRDRVRCLVLDSPMLDLNLIVKKGARRFGMLHLLTPAGKLASSIRFGINWRELDYVRRAGELAVPVLLFHSVADTITPVETSGRFVQARPDIVEYLPFQDAYHACAWNREPERYETALREFLSRVLVASD